MHSVWLIFLLLKTRSNKYNSITLYVLYNWNIYCCLQVFYKATINIWKNYVKNLPVIFIYILISIIKLFPISKHSKILNYFLASGSNNFEINSWNVGGVKILAFSTFSSVIFKNNYYKSLLALFLANSASDIANESWDNKHRNVIIVYCKQVKQDFFRKI